MPKLRELKVHEQKLVKQVDFLNWKEENADQKRAIIKLINKYRLRDATEFRKYAVIVSQLNKTIDSIRQLPVDTEPENYKKFQEEQLKRLEEKLFEMGVLDYIGELSILPRIKVERFLRRRLSYMLKFKKMAPGVAIAENFILYGHVRIGPEVIVDPTFLVTRSMEEFLQWTNASKIKKTIASYNNEYDDFELENC